MTLEQLRTRREEILAVCARHGGGNVRVFGSTARGDARPDSDIDLLIDLEHGRTLLDRSRLTLDLQAVLGRHVDALSSRGLHPVVRDEILSEAVPL